jgi:hypothetical protein
MVAQLSPDWTRCHESQLAGVSVKVGPGGTVMRVGDAVAVVVLLGGLVPTPTQ